MDEIYLVEHAEGVVEPSLFGKRQKPIPLQVDGGFDQSKLPENHVLVKLVYLSVDPYMRSRMTPSGPGYLPAWAPGETITSTCVGEVKASRCSKFPNGTLITGMMSWAEYCVIDCNQPFPIGPAEIPKMDGTVGKEAMFLGVFGTTGLTAAIGIKVKGHLKGDGTDVVVVSGAAGATGSVAGQIAKNRKAKKVIGICGTEEKCQFLKEIGFTHAINYKTQNVKNELQAACAGEVTCYFDNVGGQISENVISQMTNDSHVVLCGQISSYNDDPKNYPNKLPEALEKRMTTGNIRRERFLLLEWMAEYESCLGELIGWYTQGKLVNRETVVKGLENAGKAFCEMMSGANVGKMVVHI